MWIIKVIGFIWPFIKEMILGDKTVAETVHANKIKTLLIIIGLLSIFLNFILVQRLVVLGRKHIDQVKQVKKIEKPCPPITIVEKEPPASIGVTENIYEGERTRTHRNKKQRDSKNETQDYSGEDAVRALTRMKEYEDRHIHQFGK